MESDNEIYKLEDVDLEDFSDVLLEVEKRFGISLPGTAFKDAKTFGDICDVIQNNITLPHLDDCTTQQAFYKVRNALALSCNIAKSSIQPGSSLEEFFPRKGRKALTRRFEQELGMKCNFLAMKAWLFGTICLGLFLSLFAFIISWKIAVSGLGLFWLVLSIASFFSKELEVKTVTELVEKIANEHYLEVRRQKGTINKLEIFERLQYIFSNDLGIDKKHLTRNERLNW